MSAKRAPAADIPPALRPVVKQVLEGMAAGDCLTLEQLTDWADGALPRPKRAEVQEHLQRCPACALLAADLRPLFAPVRRLHEGWFGWQGVLWAAWGRQKADPVRENARSQHLERCAACRRKTDWLAQWRPAWRVPASSFALGAAVTALVMICVIRPAGPGPEVTPKGGAGESTGAVPWLNAQQMLERFVHPSLQELPFVLQYWEQVAEQRPHDLAPLAALQQLYAQQAAQEEDPQKRREWQEKAQAAGERLFRLLSAPGPGEGVTK